MFSEYEQLLLKVRFVFLICGFIQHDVLIKSSFRKFQNITDMNPNYLSKMVQQKVWNLAHCTQTVKYWIQLQYGISINN